MLLVWGWLAARQGSTDFLPRGRAAGAQQAVCRCRRGQQCFKPRGRHRAPVGGDVARHVPRSALLAQATSAHAHALPAQLAAHFAEQDHAPGGGRTSAARRGVVLLWGPRAAAARGGGKGRVLVGCCGRMRGWGASPGGAGRAGSTARHKGRASVYILATGRKVAGGCSSYAQWQAAGARMRRTGRAPGVLLAGGGNRRLCHKQQTGARARWACARGRTGAGAEFKSWVCTRA